MKFRTEIDIKPFAQKIDHQSRVFSIGSCFAEEMASTLQQRNFNVVSNPAGVLFNPASIASTLERFARKSLISQEDLRPARDEWFSYDFHSTFNDTNPQLVTQRINHKIELAHKALCDADWVIITFGTAWIYTLNESGKIVANCQKQPASNFTRRRLTVEEIVAIYDGLMRGVLADKQIIFTISPVRHLGDGADENFLSKSTLKVAVAEIVERFDNAHYFPSYEILNDELRDYRFYADDLVHPSRQAVEFIGEKFFDAALSKRTSELLPKIEKIKAAVSHRPRNKSSEEYLRFCEQQLSQIEALAEVNFEQEQAYFEKEIANWHENRQ